MPSRSAIRTRAAREPEPILAITCWRCTFTVASLVPSSPATCLLSSPATTSASTSRSRGVNERYRRRCAVAGERLLNGIEQILVAEGLGQKRHGPGFHRLHGHRDIAV